VLAVGVGPHEITVQQIVELPCAPILHSLPSGWAHYYVRLLIWTLLLCISNAHQQSERTPEREEKSRQCDKGGQADRMVDLQNGSVGENTVADKI
jgi:hypothetical protein